MAIKLVGTFSRNKQGNGSALLVQSFLLKPVGMLGLLIFEKRKSKNM